MNFTDAHNHLQDERFGTDPEALLRCAEQAGVSKMVVNGSCEADWPRVATLAETFPATVIPAFGYHPWYLGERTDQWKSRLVEWLDRFPNAVVGEIGLDQWILELSPQQLRARAPAVVTSPPSIVDQEAAFVWQLELAAERNLSASIHCLKAFGRLQRLLEQQPKPKRGILLHSYGGPLEMIKPFIQLGARFSFAGYFAHERKHARREVFSQIPLERLLVETDAPDQLPPADLIEHPLKSPDGTELNHPANLPAIYRYLAALRNQPLNELVPAIERTFSALFQ